MHIRTKHAIGKPVETFPCDKCEKIFLLKAKLERHSFVHLTESEGKRFQCDYCSFRTHYELSLKAHVMRRHSAEREFRCEFCVYAAKTMKEVENHVKTHVGGRNEA